MNLFTDAVMTRWATIREGRGVELLQRLQYIVGVLQTHDEKATSWVQKDGTPEGQFNGYAEFAYAIYVGKFREFLEAAAESINREHYVVMASCLRNVTEHCALLHHAVIELESVALPTKWDTGTAIAGDYDAAIKTFDRFVRGNTFAWDALIEGKPDGLQKKRASEGTDWQVSVGRTALASLSKDLPIAQTLYNLLCDMVHPNMGGHFLLYREGQGTPTVGGSGSKTPALSVAAKPLAMMLGVYDIIADDLERLQNMHLMSPSVSTRSTRLH